MLRTFFAVVIIALCAHAAFAATHYVSKTGSRTPPYDTWDHAADTVARAVEAASEWDTILIAPGHYVTDTVRMKRGQVLIGIGIDSTVLDTLPLNPLRPLDLEDSCTIRDLSITGIGGLFHKSTMSKAAGLQAGSNTGFWLWKDQSAVIKHVRFEALTTGIAVSFTNSTGTGRVCMIDSCDFRNCISSINAAGGWINVRDSRFRWNRVAKAGTIDATLSSVIVQSCVFIGLDSTTIENDASAIFTYDSEPIILRNNLFYGAMLGAALNLNQDGMTDSMQTGIIENNTFVRNHHDLLTDRPGFIFRNNICIWNHAASVFYPTQPISLYNLTWDNSPWDSGVVRPGDTIPNDLPGNVGNFDADPMFADTLDFLLQAFSPAIDAGDPTILDKDGSRSDIGYTGGPGGFTYAYSDLPPAIPHALSATPSDSQIVLRWRGNHETDFDHYDLYRDTLPIAAPDPGLLLATLTDSTYTDTSIIAGQTYYYRLTATDNQANASDPSDELSVIAAGIHDHSLITPTQFALYPNYPNPFNASTAIRYSLDHTTHVTLSIYNLLGRPVATLIDKPQSPGVHTTTWNANAQPSGVYFIVLRTGDNSRIRKALLLK